MRFPERFVAVGLAVISAVAVHGQTKLPTVDQAIAQSQRTGQPIFAMAGRAT